MTKSRGRPIKLDQTIHDKIYTAIRSGNYIETAAAYAGINKTTLYEWLKRGERAIQTAEATGRKIPAKEQPFASFSNAIEKALAEAEMNDVKRITAAARKDWHAAAWRLERKFPSRWGRKHQVFEDPEEKELRILKLKMEIELNRMELDNMTGGGKDPHDQIMAYTAALEGKVAQIFEGVEIDMDEGDEPDGR